MTLCTQKWLHFGIFIGTIATTLLNFIPPDDRVGLISAWCFTGVALVAIAYSAIIFVYRAYRLRERRAERMRPMEPPPVEPVHERDLRPRARALLLLLHRRDFRDDVRDVARLGEVREREALRLVVHPSRVRRGADRRVERGRV